MNRSDLRTLVIAIGLLACTVPVAAQETGEPPANGGVTQEPPVTALPTVEELEQRLAALSEAGGLAEDVVAKIREQYTQAIRFLGEAEAEAKRAADLRALADSAPQRFEAARAELATPTVDPVIPAPAEAKLIDLEQSLRTAQAESDRARAADAALEAETQQRSTRRVEIPQQIAAARQRLDELRAAPDAIVPNGPADLISARRISRRAEQAAATARIDALTAELAIFPFRCKNDLLDAR